MKKLLLLGGCTSITTMLNACMQSGIIMTLHDCTYSNCQVSGNTLAIPTAKHIHGTKLLSNELRLCETKGIEISQMHNKYIKVSL